MLTCVMELSVMLIRAVSAVAPLPAVAATGTTPVSVHDNVRRDDVVLSTAARRRTVVPGTTRALFRVERETLLPFAPDAMDAASLSGMGTGPRDALLARPDTPVPAARVRLRMLDSASRYTWRKRDRLRTVADNIALPYIAGCTRVGVAAATPDSMVSVAPRGPMRLRVGRDGVIQADTTITRSARRLRVTLVRLDSTSVARPW